MVGAKAVTWSVYDSSWLRIVVWKRPNDSVYGEYQQYRPIIGHFKQMTQRECSLSKNLCSNSDEQILWRWPQISGRSIVTDLQFVIIFNNIPKFIYFYFFISVIVSYITTVHAVRQYHSLDYPASFTLCQHACNLSQPVAVLLHTWRLANSHL